MRRPLIMVAGVATLLGAFVALGVAAHRGVGPFRHPAAPGPVARTDHAFDFTIRRPKHEAFPLFGAWGERAWGGASWNPHFLYPTPPRDEAGEVFTVSHGHGAHAVWVNTVFDEPSGRVQYVYVIPGVQSVLIDLALEDNGDGATTRVHVRYRRTALDADKNDTVEALGRMDATSGEEWAVAINDAIGPAAPAQ